MENQRRDIMDYYDEYSSGTIFKKQKWYKKFLNNRFNKTRGILFLLLVSLIIYCFYQFSEKEAYISLKSNITSFESDLSFATAMLETNVILFGTSEENIVIRNTSPLHIEIDGNKKYVETGGLEIYTAQIFADKPLKAKIPWPIVDGKMSIIPIRDFHENTSFIGELNPEGMIIGEEVSTKNNVILEFNNTESTNLNLMPSIYNEKISFEVIINGEKLNILQNHVTLVPVSLNGKKSLTFIAEDFDGISFYHRTPSDESFVSNFKVNNLTSNFKVNTEELSELNIVKSSQINKIEVPKSVISANGDFNSTINFNGTSIEFNASGNATDMLIAGETIFPDIFQWINNNPGTILSTIFTIFLTTILGSEFLFRKRD